MGGALAALVGVAFGVNHFLDLQAYADVTAPGRYEWQWAGDGWLGHITVEQDGIAKIYMKRYVTCDGKPSERPLLKQSGKGKVELVEHGHSLSVNIPVQFYKYEGCSNKGLLPETVLRGTLGRRAAYAGQIEYSSSFEAPVAGMALIKEAH